MTIGIEAIAAQRIQDRQAEAARAGLAKAARAAKAAETGTDRPRAWRIHLPHPALRRPAPSAHAS